MRPLRTTPTGAPGARVGFAGSAWVTGTRADDGFGFRSGRSLRSRIATAAEIEIGCSGRGGGGGSWGGGTGGGTSAAGGAAGRGSGTSAAGGRGGGPSPAGGATGRGGGVESG